MQMVSKDQTLGGAIFLVCIVVAVLYVLALFATGPLFTALGASALLDNYDVQFWLVAIPVFIAFIAILAIGAWIGWTMATTPPPKPIEEFEVEKEGGEEAKKETEPESKEES